MSNYRYIAVDERGNEVSGSAEVQSEAELKTQLASKQLILLSCKPDIGKRFLSFSTPKKLSTADLSLFTRQLSSLLAASIPLNEALAALEEQAEKTVVRSLIGQLRDQLLQGFSFAQALQSMPQTFNRLYCAMVSAGEATGYLDVVLIRLADYIEQRQKTKNKLMQALLYPILLAVVSLVVVAVLLTSVVPQVVSQLQQMHTHLPVSTRALLWISDMLNQYGLIFLILLLTSLIVARQLFKNPSRLLWLHQKLLILPIIGQLVRDLNSARYVRTMEILIGSSVPLLESMSIAANVLGNEFARYQLAEASKQVNGGKSLSEAISQTFIFSGMVKHMIGSGEQSGRLEHMLKYAADIQEESLSSRMSLTLTISEHLLLIVTAGMVFFIVMSILQPIMQLNTMV